MGFPRLLLVTAIVADLPDCLDTVAHLRPREDPERRRNPRLGYRDQPDRKGTPARTRDCQRRRGALCPEGVRGMPRGNRIRRAMLPR